jgi:hypothetical protein
VTLRDGFNNTIESYTIGDASQLDVISQHTSLVRLVKIQLDGLGIVNLAEVKVYDDKDVNVALGKIATQSSFWNPAGNAVDGNMTTFSHTSGNDAGKHWCLILTIKILVCLTSYVI